MLLIKTKLSRSSIHGYGLFAAEPILKGEIVWVRNKILDIDITEEYVSSLPAVTREFIGKYFYKVKDKIRCCIDDARFINHSDFPNLDVVYLNTEEEHNIANCNIYVGTELTVDYRALEPDTEFKL